MKVQPTVRKETMRIAKGTIILSVVMLLVFALLKRLDYTVLLGAVMGTSVAILNFFLMALSVQNAAEMMNVWKCRPSPMKKRKMTARITRRRFLKSLKPSRRCSFPTQDAC